MRLPDALIRLAERGSSFSALAANYLRSLSGRDAEFARLREQRRRIVAGIDHFSAADRLSHDEVHERRVR